jgi:putative oxidoreductase
MNDKTSAVSWILQILVALVLAASAFAKISGQNQAVLIFESLGMEPTGRLLIGGLELIAALLLFVRFSAAWGAILAWGLMTGALIAHGTHLGFTGAMLPMGLAACFNWIASVTIILLRRDQIEFFRRMLASDTER